MSDLILELKELLAQKKLSPETASRYIRISGASVVRWLKGTSKPRLASQRMILEGMERIRAELPDFRTTKEKIAYENNKEYRRLYGRVKHKLTKDDKVKLFNLQFEISNLYLDEIKKLDKKYNG